MDRVFRRCSRRFPLLLWEDATWPRIDPRPGRRGVRDGQRLSHPFAFRGGRFVLYDGRVVSPRVLGGLVGSRITSRSTSTAWRVGAPVDPFEAARRQPRLRLAPWAIGPWTLSERVARSPKAWIRSAVDRQIA